MKHFQISFSLLLTSLCSLFMLVGSGVPVYAAIPADTNIINGESAFQGLGANKVATISLPRGFEADPRELAKKIINFISGFLGILAVILVLVAGFQWMTSGGEDKKAEEAKKLLFNAVIGLVLILAAWSIAYFAVNSLGTIIQPPTQ